MAASLPVGAVVILKLDCYGKEGRNADCVDETDDGGRIGVGDDGDLEEIGDESVVGCGGGDNDDL